MRFARFAVFGLGAAMVVAACNLVPGGGGGGGETITVMSSLPRQGSSKGQTDSVVNAEKLALKQRNNAAGGYTINFVDGDDSTAEAGQWTEAKEIENATKAANDPNVIGYVGPFNSGAAKVSIPILCKAGVAQISPANTYPGLTKPGKGEANEPGVYYEGCTHNYYRTVPADDLQGLAGAKWAQQLGFTKAYVVDDSQLYGKGIADVFRAEAPGLGVEIVGNAGILGTETDYKALAEEVKNSGADLMYFGGITQQNAGQLWRDVKAANPNIGLMGPDGIFESAFLEAAGDAAEGTYITFGGLPADQLTGKGAEFVAAFNAEYPGAPIEAYSVYGYDAMNAMLDAIERASATSPGSMSDLRAAVLREVAATSNYSGALGTWSFDENGDTTLTAMSGNIVKDGAFQFETTID